MQAVTTRFKDFVSGLSEQWLFQKGGFPMRKAMRIGVSVAGLAGLAMSAAQEDPPLPKPTDPHEWLRHLEGSWEGDVEIWVDPTKPDVQLEKPQKSKATETTRMLGGFWAVPVIKGDFAGMPYEGQGQFGYDPAKGKFIGTWIDSMAHYLWQYEGSLDSARKVLTLEARGPRCDDPNTTTRYRDAHEIIDKDTRRITSSYETRDGKWLTLMKVDLKRKKEDSAALSAPR